MCSLFSLPSIEPNASLQYSEKGSQIEFMLPQVLKGLHGGVREVALKMLLEVEDPEKELARFTQVLLLKA